MSSYRGGFLAAVLSFGVLGVVRPLFGQQAPSLERGQRVRLTAPGVFVVQSIGVLEAVTADSVVLQGSYRRVAVPRAALQTLEVSRGRVSRIGPAMAVGGLVGVAVGALIGASSYKDPCAEGKGWCVGVPLASKGGAAFGGALLGGAVGALGGLLVGSAVSTERWERVPLDGPDAVRIVVAPLVGSRLGVTVSLVF